MIPMRNPTTTDDAVPPALEPPWPGDAVRQVYEHARGRRDPPTTETWLRALAAVGDRVALAGTIPGRSGRAVVVCHEEMFFLVGGAVPDDMAGRLGPSGARAWTDQLGGLTPVARGTVGFDPDEWPVVRQCRAREQFIRDLFDGDGGMG